MRPISGASPTGRAAAAHVPILAGVALCALAVPVCGQGGSWNAFREMPTPRRLLAAAAEGGKIYTFGGCGSPCFDPPLHTSTFEETRVEVYDPRLDSAGSNPWSVGAPIPAIVFGAAAASPGNGKIYLFGGFVTGNTVLEHNPAAADPWKAKTPMPTPRHGLAAAVSGGEIYVLGGSNGSAASNALEVYDPEHDSWSRRAPIPTARVFLAAAAVNGKIYAIGGSPDCCGESRTDVVEVYDPATDHWESAAPLPVALQVSAAAALGGRIYVFGGFLPGSGVQDSTFEYDPGTNAWTARPSMPVKRDQAPAVVLGTGIHVLGGSVDCHCRAIGDHHGFSPGPDLQITKDDGVAIVSPGQTVTYQITARNAGPVPVTGAVVTDDPPANLLDVSWTCAALAGASRADPACPGMQQPLNDTVDLPPGGRVEYTLTGRVGPGPTGTVVNEAKIEPPAGIQDPSPDNNLARDVDTILPQSPCGLSIEKTDGRTAAAPGETILYEIRVLNDCPAPVPARVTDDLAATGLEGTLWCRGAGCTPATAGNLDDTVTVPANGSVTYRASGTVPCACGRTEISNSACMKVSGRPTICTPPDVDAIEPPPEGGAALVLTGPEGVTDCNSVLYTATVTHPGQGTACGVVLKGLSSPGLDLVSVSAPCAAGFPCPLGDLAPGAQVAVTAAFKVKAGLQCPAGAPVTASVESLCGAAVDRAVQTEIPCDLAIAKTAELTPAACGGSSILYTIEVANRSCGAVSEARVFDDFPAGLEQLRWCRGKGCTPTKTDDPLVDDALDLPAGGQEVYRATAVVPLQLTGTLTNTASVSPPAGAPPDPTPQDDTATVDTPVVPPLGVTVCCQEISGTPWEGGAITKVFVLRNGGPAVQADNPGPEFEDTLPGELTLVSAGASRGTVATAANTVTWNGALGVGDKVTIEIEATINAGIIGLVCNQGAAFFDADGDGINESNGAAQCCLTVVPVQPVPILSGTGLAALGLLLAALALHRLRRRAVD